MLEKIFLQVLNMSLTGSAVTALVLLIRLFLKKAPKAFSYALWPAVLFRLACPVSFESVYSLLPVRADPIAQDLIYMDLQKMEAGAAAISNTANAAVPPAASHAGVNPLQIWIFFASRLWLLGAAVLLACSVITLLRLKKLLRNARHCGDNIFISDGISTAFVIGVIHPRIFLPGGLSGKERNYILLHEQTHIRRLDHIAKFAGFLVLCVHWFNPVVWLSFFESGRDMEMACDEAVIRRLGGEVKKDYSFSLLTLTTGRRIVGGTPLAFGEGGTKHRIENVLRYQKPAFWVGLVCFAAAAGIGLMANPMHTVPLLEAADAGGARLSAGALSGLLVSEGQVLEIPADGVTEAAEFIRRLRVEKKEVSRVLGNEHAAEYQIRLTAQGDPEDVAAGHLYLSFGSGFNEVWLEDEPDRAVLYAVHDPAEARAFFERQFSRAAKAAGVVSAGDLWKARTEYVGDNAAVGRLLGLLPVPQDLQHRHFELLTSGNERGIKWTLDEREYASYRTSGLDGAAMLAFTLIGNLEDLYISAEDPFGGGTELHYDRKWADRKIGGDIRVYAESPDKLQELIDLSVPGVAADTISASYTIQKLGKNGEAISGDALKNERLAEAIIMNCLVKSAAWEGVDIRTLDECYRIRQTFPETLENHDYYAYLQKDGTPVLQSGAKGMYSVLSGDLFDALVKSFE